jgi:hypothetical protein
MVHTMAKKVSHNFLSSQFYFSGKCRWNYIEGSNPFARFNFYAGVA